MPTIAADRGSQAQESAGIGAEDVRLLLVAQKIRGEDSVNACRRLPRKIGAEHDPFPETSLDELAQVTIIRGARHYVGGLKRCQVDVHVRVGVQESEHRLETRI
jgi:hypothetical protein